MDDQLHRDALALLEKYSRCEFPLETLRRRLRYMLGPAFRENRRIRWFSLSCISTEPTIRITRWHIENALGKRRRSEISEQDLIDWATTLLTNWVYYWGGDDAGLISDWLSSISLDLVPEE